MKPKTEFVLSNILIGLIILMLWSALYTSYTIGKMTGAYQYKEDMKQFNCEVGYGNKPQSEIVGECLKYFKMQEGH